MSEEQGWVGVDLDGTLATYTYGDPYWHPTKIGAPITAMVERVQRWLTDGIEVRIFTARVSEPNPTDRQSIVLAIRAWCEEHIGQALTVTNVKDYHMLELYDDRAVQVEENTGRLIGRSTRGLA